MPDGYKFAYLEERYEKLTNLGNDSVFLVKDKNSGGICVEKYVDARVLFVYEQLAGAGHTGVERVIDWAACGERGIVLTGYIAGRTLKSHMEEGLWSERRVCAFAEELLAILGELHALGIVHRDIQPSNILITDDGAVKLIDFGIARTVKPEQKKDTVILGTVGYAAPEQFGFEQTDGRADLYAVGVLMNELLTGRLPGDFLYPRGRMSRVIRRATMIDAAQRYPSASAMVHALPGTAGSGKILHWLPGFRTGVVWKEVVASFGYVLMGIYSFASVWECRGSWQNALLETLAVLLYIWLSTLLLANMGGWDRRLFPFKRWPVGARIAFRILLWMILFYMGVSLDNHVRYDLLGFPRSS